MDFKRGIAVTLTLVFLIFTVNLFANYGELSNIITTVSLNFNVNIPEYFRIEDESYSGGLFKEDYNRATLLYDDEGSEMLSSSVEWSNNEINKENIKKQLMDSKAQEVVIEDIMNNLPEKEFIDKYFIEQNEEQLLILLTNKECNKLYVYEIH